MMGAVDFVSQIRADFEAAFARLSALPAPADHGLLPVWCTPR